MTCPTPLQPLTPLHPLHIPTLPKDPLTTIKSSSSTPLFAQAGVHRHTQTNTRNRNLCTQNKLLHAPVDTNTSTETPPEAVLVCPFGWHCVKASGLLWHACVNLSRALWTLFTSQCCWSWPVSVIADIHCYSWKLLEAYRDTTDSQQHRQKNKKESWWGQLRKFFLKYKFNKQDCVFCHSSDAPNQQTAADITKEKGQPVFRLLEYQLGISEP